MHPGERRNRATDDELAAKAYALSLTPAAPQFTAAVRAAVAWQLAEIDADVYVLPDGRFLPEAAAAFTGEIVSAEGYAKVILLAAEDLRAAERQLPAQSQQSHVYGLLHRLDVLRAMLQLPPILEPCPSKRTAEDNVRLLVNSGDREITAGYDRAQTEAEAGVRAGASSRRVGATLRAAGAALRSPRDGRATALVDLRRETARLHAATASATHRSRSRWRPTGSRPRDRRRSHRRPRVTRAGPGGDDQDPAGPAGPAGHAARRRSPLPPLRPRRSR
jgi:hypothetical protein